MTPDERKQAAMAFYNLMFNECRPREAIEPNDDDYAGIDIFRFDVNDKIVEHWDVLQVLPTESKNDNGMF
jgi:predicted SnoaL-like aldol condensation-catalyzing enzyme